MNWEKSCKLGLLCCSLIIFVVGDRLNLRQAYGMMAAVGGHLPQYHHHGHAICPVPVVSLVLLVC